MSSYYVEQTKFETRIENSTKTLQTNDLWYNGLSYIQKISLTVLYYYPEVITLTLTKINLTVGVSVPSMKQKMYIL